MLVCLPVPVPLLVGCCCGNQPSVLSPFVTLFPSTDRLDISPAGAGRRRGPWSLKLYRINDIQSTDCCQKIHNPGILDRSCRRCAALHAFATIFLPFSFAIPEMPKKACPVCPLETNFDLARRGSKKRTSNIDDSTFLVCLIVLD